MDIVYNIALEFLKMVWDISWGLAFGFILSSLIRAFISTETIANRLGKNSISSVGLSTLFGAISSSCSYAAASMSRTLIMKGATWTNAVSFLVASTNLVFEIFIVITAILGWSFVAGEIIGGLFFIVTASLFIIWLFPDKTNKQARKHVSETDKKHSQSADCCHNDHEHQHSSEKVKKSSKTTFSEKLNHASEHFYMDVSMVGKDILIGVAIASILMVVVPSSFWQGLFLSGNSNIPHFLVLCWNAIIGSVIAIVAFVCSVGNIVMASVLWAGGISFGGVIAFILSDLITIPMLMVYRRYYGLKTMWTIFGILFISIFLTSLFLDYSFEILNWIPKSPASQGSDHQWNFEWNYESWLNVIFIPTAVLYFFYGKRQIKKEML